jgi:hypothetical protein
VKHVILIIALLLWALLLNAVFANQRALMYAFFFAGAVLVGFPFLLLAASRKNMWIDLQVKPTTIREKHDAPEEFWNQVAKFEPVLHELGYSHIESFTLKNFTVQASPSIALYVHQGGDIVAAIIVTETQIGAGRAPRYATRLDLSSERISGESLNTVSNEAPLLGPPPLNQRFALIEQQDLKTLHSAHSRWIRREGPCSASRSSAAAIWEKSHATVKEQYIASGIAHLDAHDKLQLTRRGFVFALLSIVPAVRRSRSREAKQRGHELLRELTL